MQGFGRHAFVICAALAGAALALVAISVGVLASLSLYTAFHSTGEELKRNADACTTLFGIMGIAVTALLYLIRLVFQREFDSAIDFSVRISAIPSNPGEYELLAILKNVTSIAAGVESIAYDICDPETGSSILESTESRGWKRPTGTPPILTRNTTWQLAQLVLLPKGHEGKLHKLVAVCRIGMQPANQGIYFEKLFPV